LEVHYRWHPYFGCKVVIRRIAQRATGRFLSILGPAGVIVTIADWMLDPIVCAAMPKGTPRVDLAALVELKRLLEAAGWRGMLIEANPGSYAKCLRARPGRSLSMPPASPIAIPKAIRQSALWA
jgi:hypothetical protein